MTGSGPGRRPDLRRAPAGRGQDDYIGITLVSGSSVGDLGRGGDQIFEVDGDLNVGDDVDSTAPENFEPMISANVEPDADSDGYGDETEDGCPSNAATQGACPVAAKPFVPPFVRRSSRCHRRDEEGERRDRGPRRSSAAGPRSR